MQCEIPFKLPDRTGKILRNCILDSLDELEKIVVNTLSKNEKIDQFEHQIIFAIFRYQLLNGSGPTVDQLMDVLYPDLSLKKFNSVNLEENKEKLLSQYKKLVSKRSRIYGRIAYLCSKASDKGIRTDLDEKQPLADKRARRGFKGILSKSVKGSESVYSLVWLNEQRMFSKT